jgi:hypothetical protein
MKSKPKPDNPAQYKRFLETAREAGAEEQAKAFNRVLDKVARGAPEKPKRRGSPTSRSG